uniref:Ixodegrin B n=1 Tax=Rhipicephalus zambeziensis TaxID=60191 RepID=A0A224YLN8_9ACAR
MQYTLEVTFVLLLAIRAFQTEAYRSYFQEEWGFPQQYHNKGYGRNCKNSSECRQGLCCVRKNSQGSCQPLASPGRPCSNEQIKGNCYEDHCPCIFGYDYCQNGFCRYHKWLE